MLNLTRKVETQPITPTFSKGPVLAILSAACYGLSVVITKSALDYLNPSTLLTIEISVSVAFIWTVILLQGQDVYLGWNELKASLPGVLEPGLSYIFATIGIGMTTASNASLIGTVEPILTIALAGLILRDKISSILLSLGVVACFGIGLVAFADSTVTGHRSLSGDALLILAVICSSLYAICTRSSMAGLPPLHLAALQQTIALVWFLLVMSFAPMLHVESIALASVNAKGLMLAIASGIFGNSVAFWLYLSALRQQSLSVTSLYLTLIPIFGVIGACLFLGERLLPFQVFGGALILLAVSGISHTKEPL